MDNVIVKDDAGGEEPEKPVVVCNPPVVTGAEEAANTVVAVVGEGADQVGVVDPRVVAGVVACAVVVGGRAGVVACDVVVGGRVVGERVVEGRTVLGALKAPKSGGLKYAAPSKSTLGPPKTTAPRPVIGEPSCTCRSKGELTNKGFSWQTQIMKNNKEK